MSAPDNPGASPNADDRAKAARLVTAINYRAKALELSLAAWPVFEQSAGTNTSGLACALVVMRHLLCHFPSPARDAYLAEVGAEAVAENMLLTAAISTDREVASELCQRLQDSLHPDELSFERLMDAEIMQATAWKTRYFCFFGDSYERDSKQEPWRPLPDSAMPVTEKDFLTWDGVQKKTIGEYINIFSTSLVYHETGRELVKFTNAPLVLRIVLANKNPTLDLYRDLFRFTLWLVSRGHAPRRSFSYSCAAAVRVRATPDGNDSLRLYNSDGSHFRPEGGTLPWSDTWRVEDGDRYVLFFIRFDAFPEDPAPLAESNRNTEGLALVRLARADELRKVSEQQAAGDSPPPVRVSPEAESVPAQSPSPQPTPIRRNPMLGACSSVEQGVGLFGASASVLSSWQAEAAKLAAGSTSNALGDRGDTDVDTQATRANSQSNEPVNTFGGPNSFGTNRGPPPFASSGNARRTHRGRRHSKRNIATDANQEAILNPRLTLANSGNRQDAPALDDDRQERIAPRQRTPSFGESPRRHIPEFVRRSLSPARNPRQNSRTYGRNPRDYDTGERDYSRRR
ncbi:uncharacterized protein B0H64DRAFT_452316 [Chaetomium fimeti]|uniref:Uncharacterized protein n=1 Tax=Chaetomium fimeti TaxID=1854472 RepID=A0AAE0H5J3_9PEZI|nr:hypothetical protein B0H64DRAFT_452316 [Chaetomium fimeti]